MDKSNQRCSSLGTSARLYGVWQNAWSNGQAQAAYSIDGQSPQFFVIPAIPPAYTNLFIRDLLFETPELIPGPHTLEVTAPTTTGGRPLAIGNFVIQNAPAVPAENLAGIPQALPVGAPTDDVTAISASKENTGALTEGSKIAIGVSVTVAGLLVFALAGLFVYRRKQKAKRALRSEETLHDVPVMSFNGHKSSTSVSTKAGSIYDEKKNLA